MAPVPARIQGWLMVFSLFVPPAFAGEGAATYPRAMSERLAAVVRADALEGLKTSYEAYTELHRDAAAVAKTLAAERGWNAGQVHLLDAELKDGRIRLRSPANLIEVSAEDYVRGTLGVNGKEFRWDSRQPASENLQRFTGLLNPEGKPAAWRSWLAADAWAGEPGIQLAIQASGLFLQWVVDRKGGRGEVLKRFDVKVVEEFKICQSSQADDYRARTFQLAYDANARVADYMKDLAMKGFKTCAEVKEFAKDKQAAVPKDLCANLAKLAACVKALVPATAETFRSKPQDKYTKPDQAEEWQDPASPAPAAAGAGK